MKETISLMSDFKGCPFQGVDGNKLFGLLIERSNYLIIGARVSIKNSALEQDSDCELQKILNEIFGLTSSVLGPLNTPEDAEISKFRISYGHIICGKCQTVFTLSLVPFDKKHIGPEKKNTILEVGDPNHRLPDSVVIFDILKHENPCFYR